MSNITAVRAVTGILDNWAGRFGLRFVFPPVPSKPRHCPCLNHGLLIETTGSRIMPHAVALGANVLALGLGNYGIVYQTQRDLVDQAGPLVVAWGIAVRANGHAVKG